MGYFSSSDSVNEGKRDPDVEKTKKLMVECMDLISERNRMIERVSELDEKIAALMNEIKQDPACNEIKQVLEGLMKPSKKGRQ